MKPTRTSFVARFRQMVKGSSFGSECKKRAYEESFGTREYEKERYGQEIIPDYFVICQGHAVYAPAPEPPAE